MVEVVDLGNLLQDLVDFDFDVIVHFLFFDSHTILDYYELYMKKCSIEKEISYYSNLSRDSKEKINQLESDMSSLEKFAREQFLMKRPDEDIFLFEEKK